MQSISLLCLRSLLNTILFYWRCKLLDDCRPRRIQDNRVGPMQFSSVAKYSKLIPWKKSIKSRRLTLFEEVVVSYATKPILHTLILQDKTHRVDYQHHCLWILEEVSLLASEMRYFRRLTIDGRPNEQGNLQSGDRQVIL